MEAAFWILLAVGAAYGVARFLRHRESRESARQARAEKKARVARNDAQAIQRSLDGRR